MSASATADTAKGGGKRGAGRRTIDRRKGRFGLQQVARRFFAYPTPWMLLVSLVSAWTARLVLGTFSWWDLVIPAIILAIWPFQEWVIHVFLLHWKPRTLLGIRLDPLVARKHREHHMDPWREDCIFVPTPVLVFGIPLIIGFWWLITPSLPLMLTGLAFHLTVAFFYEWTHFIIHTPYRPQSRLYKHLWRNHRLHHCKNEHYWYGVTMTLGDRVLRTAPDFKKVETSPTCRTLGQEDDLGEDHTENS